MKQFVMLIALVALPLSLFGAPKFPFPHRVAYNYGIMPKSIDHDRVQKAYEDFMKLYDEQGDLARIKYDNTTFTVSEGIGYGMIILVYMDNETNNTQAKFDKLWNYYKRFSNGNGLMNWKVNGFSGVDQNDAATDAEVDVALALLQAHKQWDDEKYLNDAKNLIEKISRLEVNGNGFLKPGDAWDLKKNPSYFSTGAMELYKKASGYDWGRVIGNSYSLIKKSQNQTTGLVPNWCNEDGTYRNNPGDDNYTYDATRTPWRIAWAYSWYGHQDAKDICTKIASWISTKTGNDPTAIVDGYKVDGSTISEFHNATFVGPFACAGMVDSAHQEWVDKSYAHLDTMKETVYFQISLKILTLLYLSGNMPNLWDYPKTGVNGTSPDMNKISATHPAGYLQKNSSGLSFTTASAGRVTISLYTVSGKLAATPVNRVLPAGSHRISLGPQLPNGTYLVKMRTGSGAVTTERMAVAR